MHQIRDFVKRCLNECRVRITESSEDRFGLDPTTDVDSMVSNLFKISGENGNRKVVVDWAMKYVMEYPEITKKFKEKYNINSKSDFEAFMGRIQVKSRSLVNKQRKNDGEEYKRFKAMDDLSAIEKMALDQSKQWDDMIAKKYGSQ